jgi:hypothetical protein
MSNLILHLERELRCAGLLSGTNPREDKLVDDLRGIIKVIEAQDHSGGSLFTTLQFIDRLINLKPLTPLTGRPDEWDVVEADDTVVKINKRCPTVMVLKDGSVVDVGMHPVYIDPDGLATTRSDGPLPPVAFPYMPGFPPTIAVDANGNPLNA